VSAQRVTRQGDGLFKRATASVFYWIMRRAVDERLVPEVGDFRLFSRSVNDRKNLPTQVVDSS
jgi:dolichol-phosphate mannosyltransferase